MKQVILNFYVEVDNYNQEENYFGEIVDQLGNVIYDHYNALKSFAFREDMVFDLYKKCAEYGFDIKQINDETFVSSYSEEI
jgi:hypothetical protein